MHDIKSVIKDMDFFLNLTDEQVMSVASYFTEEEFIPGEIVFEEFTPGDSFFIILEGEIEIYKHLGQSVDTTQAKLDVLKPYSYFGEMSLVDDYPRSATARARTNVKLLKMTKRVFIDICMKYPMVIFNLMKTISHRLRNTNQKFVEIVDQMIKESRMAAIGSAASKIIHDIKTPITVMILTAELISNMFEDADTLTQKIVKQAKNLDEMIREILDFARGEQSSLDLKEVDLPCLFDDLESSIGAIASSKNIELIITNKITVPVVFDEGKLKRVIANLIKNAVEAIKENEKIYVTAEIEHNYFKVVIQDTGTGIPADIIDTIFEPFVTKGKKGGTGLGLAICKKIVEDHKGNISVSNLPNSGARFEMNIPLIKLH
jgi:signal transduction histidine kinase